MMGVPGGALDMGHDFRATAYLPVRDVPLSQNEKSSTVERQATQQGHLGDG